MTAAIYRSESTAAAVEALYRDVLDRWPVPKEELHLPTCQGRTFVLACGPKDAPPVLLLHGAQANSAAWLPDIALWASRFRLYAVDVIGEPGLSEPVRPDLTGDAHASWLDDVVKGLGLMAMGLVGTSLGGWLALDYAKRRPMAVRALALMCPAGIGRQKNLLLWAAPLLLLGSWGKRKIRKMVFGPPPKELPAELQLIAGLMDSISGAVRPRIVDIPRLTDDELRGLAMPILAVLGGRDVFIDSAETRLRLERNAPHAKICFIENGYHFLPDQSAEIFAFLKQNVPA
ncbi:MULTISPECIES: alpha/beta hydrolase [unclassified Bosea (in: a-proteobacteria)]|uniref:alpha/beta fold hydrolase n=1 Tax=unclassified Bosea (in: a-proteobacteria) TaxID=2653178 RepID=UPI000F75B89F|nr:MULTISPECIES: alpha/beta hydrolase [unclassified Bosea (in: a-proteobacteria)]AZO82140.1 carboxylesterase [Bosea sp. Tri-49]RXT20708.1 carboxylesterase [Bosea sp. Tri-39]RXT33743.1 carboxylesterase [Bosea sp. Tri-54]